MGRSTHIASGVFVSFNLLLKLRDCLVPILIHYRVLTDQNGSRDNEIAIEELLWRERAVGCIVGQTKEKKDSGLLKQSVTFLSQQDNHEVLTEASKAPVTNATIVPEYLGKAFAT